MGIDKRYEITVTEHVWEKRISGKEWEVGAGKPEKGDGSEGNYGYTPEIEKTVKVQRQLFSQNTDKLDLISVIKAINGL